MTEKNKLIFDEYRELINSSLEKICEKRPQLREIICEAMEYSLCAGGKRIRPMLVLEFCRICGGDYKKYVEIACCIEMIHTFSLIHDDLPCMDNDDFRRGRPSCHKKFPESIALLAGDALNTLPFEIISDYALKGVISFETAVKLNKIISHAVGVEGMIGGQVIDIESEKRKISLDELNTLQTLKTGALIEASCEMGCVLAGRDDLIDYAKKYAEYLGRAFQIVDDILDVEGSFEEMGKTIGKDENSEKSTYVTLLGLEKSKEISQKLTNDAVKILENFENADYLIDLTKYLLERKN